MIQAWQQARSKPVTGFLTAPQQQALLAEAAPALAKYDDDEKKKADAAAKAADAAAKAAAADAAARTAVATPPPHAPAGSGPSGYGGPAPAGPRASGGDAAYCGELSALYRKYLKNAPGHKSDFRAAIALENCAKGNTMAGIPVLEDILRREQFTLPAR